MERFDYRTEYRNLYSAKPTAVQELSVPPLQFVSVNGQGSPQGPDFLNAVGALYSLSYTLKMSRKRAGHGPDYTIAPLEGLWWMADGSDFDQKRTPDWRWTLMIMQPPFITPAEFKSAVATLSQKKPSPTLERLALTTLEEDRVVQLMHIGPYDAELPSVQKLAAFCSEKHYQFIGKHHEIYLSDPRRTRPDRLRTILRRPIKALG